MNQKLFRNLGQKQLYVEYFFILVKSTVSAIGLILSPMNLHLTRPTDKDVLCLTRAFPSEEQ